MTEKGAKREYNDEKRGVLFKNTLKSDERHPDWRGHVTIEGKKYGIVAWERRSKAAGDRYFSLAISEWREQQ